MKNFILLPAAVIMSLSAMAQSSSFFEYEYEGFPIKYDIIDEAASTVEATQPGAKFYYEDNLPATITLPSTVMYEGKTYIVTSVKAKAFSGYGGYTTVKLPGTIKSFGKEAFYGTEVTTVDFPSVEYICTIDFASADENPISYVPEFTINGKRVTDLVIPAVVKNVKDFAFYGASITSLNTSNVVEIGREAFSECQQLKSVEITSSVKKIGNSAFLNDNGMEKASFPGIKEMCAIEYVSPQSNPLYWGHSLYINGEYVTDLEIPEGIMAIGSSAFAGSNISSVKIPNSVTSISQNAFRSCRDLTELSIPASVQSIGGEAFTLTGITQLTIEDGLTPIDCGYRAFPSLIVKELYLGRTVVNFDLNVLENLESLRLGNLITEVAASGFKNLAKLNSVSFGSALKNIGESAFSGCKELTAVILPPALEIIGRNAFANTSLKTIEMGPNVQTINGGAFEGCPIESLAITAQQTPAVGDGVFSNYDWTLFVQGETAKAAYAASSNIWNRVQSELLVDMTHIKYEGQSVLTGKPGDTFALTASVRGDDASLKSVFWKSTNPAIATVDLDGLVTLQGGAGSADEECEIIAESLYYDAPVIKVKVQGTNDGSGVEEIVEEGAAPDNAIDFAAPYAVYGLEGHFAGNSLQGLGKGIYVIRQGNAVKKMVVK